MKPKGAKRISDRQLAPLIRFAAGNYGAVAAIKREMDRRTGRTWSRVNIGRWLHPDPVRRTEPLLEAGLILFEVGRELMRSAKQAKEG